MFQMQSPKACFHTSSSAFSQKPLSLLNNSSMLKCLLRVHPTSEAHPFSRIPSSSFSCTMPGIPHSDLLSCSRALPGWTHSLFRINMLMALKSASLLRRLLESSLGLKAALPEPICQSPIYYLFFQTSLTFSSLLHSVPGIINHPVIKARNHRVTLDSLPSSYSTWYLSCFFNISASFWSPRSNFNLP